MNTTATRFSLAAAISPAASPVAHTPPPTAHPFAEMLRQAHAEPASPIQTQAPAPQHAPMRPATDAGTEKKGRSADPAAAAAKAAERSDDDAAGDAFDATSTTAALKVRARLAAPPGKSVPSEARTAAAPSAPADARDAATQATFRAAVREDHRGTTMADGAAGVAALSASAVFTERADVAARSVEATDAAATSSSDADASVDGGNVDAPAADAKSQRHRISPSEAGATASPFGPHVAVREEKAAAAREAQANAAQRIEGASPRPAASTDSSAAMASLAQGVSAPTPAAAAPAMPAVAHAYVPAPVESPAFAAAFGVQVSVLAHDGVQRAELHLNPAEMGPVAIRIRIEGREAHIDFGAEVAATRQAIEASLPQLAGALDDAGFTLAGGGVSQHTGQQARGGESQEDVDARNGRGGDRRFAMPANAEAMAKVAGRINARIAAGGVDLYA